MKTSEAKAALRHLLPTGKATYLWGPPGLGKSQIVKQVAEEMGVPLIDWRALYRDPVDARGVPSVQNGRTYWNIPAEFPMEPDSSGIFFMDEVAQAPPTMQQVCGQIALERKCGDCPLPKGWMVVSASNRVSDRAGANRVLSNVLNRFIHLDIEVDAEDWVTWAMQERLPPVVPAFIRFRPNLLFTFDPARNERAVATPRSWHALADLFPSLPETLRMPVAAGTVGPGPAAEFMAFEQVWQSLPDVDAILKSPQTAKIPPRDQPATMYALCGALAERSRNLDCLDPVAAFAMRMPHEFSMLCLKDVATANTTVANGKLKSLPKLSKAVSPLMETWRAKHPEIYR